MFISVNSLNTTLFSIKIPSDSKGDTTSGAEEGMQQWIEPNAEICISDGSCQMHAAWMCGLGFIWMQEEDHSAA